MKKRSYTEIFEDVEKARYGKECRCLHKELRDAGYGGLPMFMRYPQFPIIIETFALIVGLAVGITSILQLLLKRSERLMN